jgi:protein involved in temperature-dependent protein secretion
MTAPVLLDSWLPNPAVRSHHRRAARADPDRLWRAARELRLSDTRVLGRLVRWRIPGTPSDLSFAELFRCYPFALLAEDERCSVSGLCGRIWTLQRDYPRIDGPDEFRTWDEPGAVRVLFATWVEDPGDGRAELVSEARVAPTDASARVRLRALWTVIGTFERVIATEPLPIAVRRAEASS